MLYLLVCFKGWHSLRGVPLGFFLNLGGAQAQIAEITGREKAIAHLPGGEALSLGGQFFLRFRAGVPCISASSC